MQVVFATCSEFPDGVQDDRQAAASLGAEFRCWDDPAADWAAYDRVVIRSTWDYTTRLDEFLAWVHRVGPQRLRNDPELVAFNTDKRYLAELSCPTVPTVFVEPGDPLPELGPGQRAVGGQRGPHGGHRPLRVLRRHALLRQTAGVPGAQLRGGQRLQPPVVLGLDQVQGAAVQPRDDQRAAREGGVDVRGRQSG